ncbi:MAG: flagellar export protein FliJ [Spirochaetaceae bacterium]
MKRFHFKLDPLLRIREHVERQAQHALADVNAELIAVNRKLEWLSMEIDQTVTGATGHPSPDGQVDVNGLYAREAYVRRMQRELEAGFRDRTEVETRLDSARERFNAAHRETEVLARLRETRSSRHYAEARRVQAVELDDVVGARAVRRVEEGVEYGQKT